MKWFFRWLYDGIKEVESEDREDSPQYTNAMAAGLVARRPRGPKHPRVGLATAKSSIEDHQVHLNQSAMNFRLYPATGGHIVEYSYYDERKDQNTQALHLIASDQDLGESLSKIMTLEALRR